MEIGIVILATNAYFPLGVRFMKRFHHFYTGKEKIKFFFFSDSNPMEYIPDDIWVEYIFTTNDNWVDGTNLKFKSIISLDGNSENSLTHLFYFDADTNINREFTEDWFIGDMVGGQHYADESWMKENKGFDRNPLSKAYVPHDTTLFQMYFYGAFFGGTKENMIEFCKKMREYQLEDKKINYEPGVNDESYINREFHFHPPTKIVFAKDFQFLISDKGGIGETRNMKLNISHLLKDLKENKNVTINIQNGKVTK